MLETSDTSTLYKVDEGYHHSPLLKWYYSNKYIPNLKNVIYINIIFKDRFQKEILIIENLHIVYIN